VRQGKLTEEQAAEHPQRSIITRALGIELDVEVDTWTYPARPGDVVLLCSDGLTSMIDEDRIAEILSAEPSLERASERLVAAANDAGGRDNITVVLFRLEDAGGDTGDHPTIVGMAPPPDGEEGETRLDRRPSEVSESNPAHPAGGAIMIAPPPAIAQRPTAPRLARTQGRRQGPPRPRRRRSERFIKTMSGLIALGVVLFLVGGGAYLASRQYFFLGTNTQGILTIYRGFPYDLPLGVRMYEQWYVSAVPIRAIPADRRSGLLNHQLRSQNNAVSVIHAAELGQLSR
jgi:protein phosphatase